MNFGDVAIATGQYPFPVKGNVVPGSDAAGSIAPLTPVCYSFTKALVCKNRKF